MGSKTLFNVVFINAEQVVYFFAVWLCLVTPRIIHPEYTHQEDDGILVLRRTAVYSHVTLRSPQFSMCHRESDVHRRPKNIGISPQELDCMVSLNNDPG